VSVFLNTARIFQAKTLDEGLKTFSTSPTVPHILAALGVFTKRHPVPFQAIYPIHFLRNKQRYASRMCDD